MDNEVVLNEVPSSLKRLVRMVMRGFYTIEHVIVVDMLIRNPCIKEDDLVDLLKFERKQLRAVIAQLKNDRFVKSRLRMETGPDGKTARQNYYYINYKVFVNVVKYKLDHMRRKIETEERDSTSRASFRCTSCNKTFTDLEADQLCDFKTGEFRCSYCSEPVEEDQSALPKTDSRLLLASFNDQIEPLYNLLRQVEDIKLAPELLEPEPTDMTQIKKDAGGNAKPRVLNRYPGDHNIWSGDATRSRDFFGGGAAGDQPITVSIGNEATDLAQEPEKKKGPIWMIESTVEKKAADHFLDSVLQPVEEVSIAQGALASTGQNQDDIMEALLAHEKKGTASSQPYIPGQASGEESDTSESEEEMKTFQSSSVLGDLEDMESDEEDIPCIIVGNERIPLGQITEEHIANMTPSEKENYIQISQEMYAHMYD